MGHVRGAALLAATAFAIAVPARAIDLENTTASNGRAGFVDDAIIGRITLHGLSAAAMRVAESARVAEQVRQSFRGGPSSNLSDPDLGPRSLPLGAKRMLELRTNRPQTHLSARKLASIGGMWTNYGTPHKALTIGVGTVASELGLRFVARPLGQEVRLSPWSNKHGSGFSAVFSF